MESEECMHVKIENLDSILDQPCSTSVVTEKVFYFTICIVELSEKLKRAKEGDQMQAYSQCVVIYSKAIYFHGMFLIDCI